MNWRILNAANYGIGLNIVKMATLNAWIYIPWLAYRANGFIDWNTPEVYREAIRSFKDWERMKASKIHLLLTHIPKSNTLKAWI